MGRDGSHQSGNYADSKKFAIKEYTDEQYAAELKRIEEKFTPLVLLCKQLGRAMRIGTNHGSLSDRIMNRFAIRRSHGRERAGICADRTQKRLPQLQVFDEVVKSESDDRMLSIAGRAARSGRPDWNYPVHLGVTEAGDGEDGRLKSAIGIGSLLCDGFGDTIRVSLTKILRAKLRSAVICSRKFRSWQIWERQDSTFNLRSSVHVHSPANTRNRARWRRHMRR